MGALTILMNRKLIMTRRQTKEAKEARKSDLALARKLSREGAYDDAAQLFNLHGISYEYPVAAKLYN